MNPEASSSEPLLAYGYSSSTEIPVLETIDDADCIRAQGQMPSFYNDYGIVGGVPTRVIKPSEGRSRFTAYALSFDGTRLATGERNGCVKVWDTADYFILHETHHIFNRELKCLTFVGGNQRLAAIDFRGNMTEFRFASSEKSMIQSSEASKSIEIKNAQVVRYTKLEKGCSMFQFSADGYTLVCSCFFNSPIFVYRFTSSEIRKSTLKSQGFRLETAFLSANGNSVLSCSDRDDEAEFDHSTSVVHVWPRLSFNSDDDSGLVKLTGDRASWGQSGKYLLVWNSYAECPKLSVYETEKLISRRAFNRPIAVRVLDAGLSNWKATVLSSSPDDLSVLICEIGKSRKRRFYVWNAFDDKTRGDLVAKMPSKRTIDASQWTFFREQADCIIESDLPVRTFEASTQLAIEDAYPVFCVSADGQWIAAFSWRHHACIVCSVDKGIIVWSFTIPDEIVMDPFRMPNRLMFAPDCRHLLLIGDAAVFACAPTFLNPDGAIQVQTEVLPEDDVFDTMIANPLVAEALKTVSSQTLSRMITHRIANGLTDFGMASIVRNVVQVCVWDIAVSSDGMRMAYIAYNWLKEDLFVFFIEGNPQSAPPSFRESKASRLATKDKSDPQKLFLFPTDGGGESLIVLSWMSRQVMVFWDLAEKTYEVQNLQVERRFRSCQTQDRRRLLMLSNQGVSVLDLNQRCLVELIPYRIDFNIIRGLNTNTSKKDPRQKYRRPFCMAGDDNYRWARKLRYRWDFDPNRCISDDGRSLLLGWDAKNRRSLIVTPETSHERCEELIQSADRTLSNFCVLTQDGSKTLFVDVEELSKGRITVGIYNNADSKIERSNDEEIAHRVHVIDNPIQTLTQLDDMNTLLSGIGFDLSEDGSLLFVVMTPFAIRKDLQIEECIKAFSMYGTSECLPTYDDLSKGDQIGAAAVDRLYETFGCCSVFSTPSLSGQTIFQEAFMKKHQATHERMTALSKHHEADLSMEWSTPNGTNSDLVRLSLETRSTNKVRRALQLIGKWVTPFVRAANIMKNCFKDVLLEHADTTEYVLKNNLLVCKLAEVKVHVDYVNPRLRRDAAVHIDTCDSVLEWKIDDDLVRLTKKWRAKNASTIASMESRGNRSATVVTLMAVCIEDAAKIGMNGIVRPLLLQGAAASVFESDVVKWVLLYKWMKIWRKHFIRSAALYFVFLVVFLTYAVWLADSAEVTLEDSSGRIALGLMVANFAFGIWICIGEMVEMMTYVQDGLHHFGTRFWGVRYFFSSRWNWVDSASCLLLIVFIPALHLLALLLTHEVFEDCLSIAVAIEAVFASIKVWYFAQPFRVTGALVLMIDNIVKDCVAFLMLALIVLFGFALALHVLFRGHVEPEIMNFLSPYNAEDTERDTVKEAFDTFPQSLATLFYAMLGTFEPEIYHSHGHLSWVTVATFSIYMVAQMVVLLNLLIAIMGDTFDRVKSTEQAQLLMGRAKFIDACEAGLGQAEKEKMDNEIGRYLLVLSGIEETADKESSTRWMGRMNMMEESFRREIKASEEGIHEMIRSMEIKTSESVSQLENKLDAAVDRLQTELRDIRNSTSSQLEKLVALLEKSAENVDRSVVEPVVQIAEEQHLETVHEIIDEQNEEPVDEPVEQE